MKKTMSMLLVVLFVFCFSVAFAEDNSCDHNWSGWKTVKEASCTADGTQRRICSECGTTEDKAIPAKGHTEVVDAAVEATCTKTGLIAGKHCSVCGEILKAQEEIPALGHKAEKVEGKAATCTEAGLTDGEKCSECGEILKAQEEIPALGHSYKKSYSLSSDGTKRIITYTCTRCGDTYSEEEEIN